MRSRLGGVRGADCRYRVRHHGFGQHERGGGIDGGRLMRVWGWGAPRVVVASSFALVLLVVAGGATGERTDVPGEQIGTPWTGETGNQRTTAAIMAERQAPSPQLVQGIPVRHADVHRQPNPDSPPTTGDTRV